MSRTSFRRVRTMKSPNWSSSCKGPRLLNASSPRAVPRTDTECQKAAMSSPAFCYGPRQVLTSVARVVLISFEGLPDDPDLTVDHIDGDVANDDLKNLQFLIGFQNYRKGGRQEAHFYEAVDMSAIPTSVATDIWTTHPTLPHVQCSESGYLRLTAGRGLIPLNQGWYGHRNARVAGVWPWLSVHRAIAETFVCDGPIPEGMVVHHRDGDATNNAHTNLQIITPAQNARYSRRFHGSNTSGVNGVYWSKQRKMWIAMISVEGQKKYLGASR
ncbi:hypothetical protein DFS34DRAFT_95663 [Phlyctochytrium arcticum]|nr:hypothetical protein DFS34DRAFT_95663 [Phlyctochytrium arcticum]